MIDVTTTRLLIADMVRRQYGWPAMVALSMVALPWWAADADHVQFAFSVSLGITFVLGPMATIIGRPVFVTYLPVSRRETWFAAWFVATVVATAATTAVKLPAVLFGLDVRDGGLGTIALSSAYDFASAGVGCVLVAAAQRPAGTLPLIRHLRFLPLVTFVSGPIWIFALHGRLPIQWTELNGLAGTVRARSP